MKMKKRDLFFGLVFCAILLVMISSLNMASAVQINKTVITDVVAAELSIPAKYNFKILNDLGYDENLSIYSLVDVDIKPDHVFVENGAQKTFVLSALPKRRFEIKMGYEYFVKAPGRTAVKDMLILEIVPLKEILFADLPSEFNREDQAVNLVLTNKKNIDLGTFNFSLESDLFKYSQTISLGPEESRTITIPLDLKNKYAGDYKIKFTAFLNNEYNYEISIPATLKEISSIVTSKEKKFNFFGYKQIITDKNEGNSRKIITIELNLSGVENAFTDYNVPPTSKEKKNGKNVVTWQRELQPGESFTAEARTRYTIPIILIIILAIALISYIVFLRKKVIVKKKAIKLRTKGDEFAVKVILAVKNIGGTISNVTLTDHLPLSTKLYEKFGSIKPDKIESHRLQWNFNNLVPGEEVVVSYIVYSKVGMFGPIHLPEAYFTFTDEKNTRHQVNSGKVYVL